MSICFFVVPTNNRTIIMKKWSQKFYDCWKFITEVSNSPLGKISGLQKNKYSKRKQG